MPNDPVTEHLRVRVAVLTYKRPQDIREALPRLVEQARTVSDGAARADVLVVDNDPEGSARETVLDIAAQHADIDVHYENEIEPGISAARNRALAASADCDVLVFIDDDERPSERWLASLLATYRAHGSAAVVGPVRSEFEVEPDAWVRAGRFFDRRRFSTGTEVTVAATNNLLLDLRQIRALGREFDARVGISGGGDTMFTRDLHRRGGRLVWCSEAMVVDVVPAARSTRDWVLRRSLRSGTSESAVEVTLATSLAERTATRARLTVRGLARIAGGAARVVLGTVTRSLGHRARGMRTLARGAGLLSGAWGYEYKEYRRARGR